MEITPETLSKKLDSAVIFYHRSIIDHGQQIKILDGNKQTLQPRIMCNRNRFTCTVAVVNLEEAIV